MKTAIGIAALSIVLLFTDARATTIHWNLNSLYGVSQAGFDSIITDARNHFLNAPNDSIIVDIDSGTYNIGGNGNVGINLTGGIKPGLNGRLIFQGAGMDATKLVFTEVAQDMIKGFNAYRLEFRDMHMARAQYTVTQGIVVSVDQGEIVLDIQPGFPTPLDIFNAGSSGGRYLRRYTNSTTDPQLIPEDNSQVPWGWRSGALKLPELVSGSQWRIYINNGNLQLNNYTPGELVGVKSKHEGNAYWFNRGSDLVFANVRWTGSSRGLVRGGYSNVLIKDCRIDRDVPSNGQVPCMATPSGGPQMNQEEPDTSTNMVVDNLFCDSPGDDCVAFFNVTGGKVLNSTLRNSFARGIYMMQNAYDICVAGTTIPNSPLQFDDEPLPTLRPPLFTFDLDDAYAAGIIYDSCQQSPVTPFSSGMVKVERRFINIYPNPAEGFLTIKGTPAELKELSIYDPKGQNVTLLVGQEKRDRNTIQLNVGQLRPGLYFIRTATFSRKVLIGNVVKNGAFLWLKFVDFCSAR